MKNEAFQQNHERQPHFLTGHLQISGGFVVCNTGVFMVKVNKCLVYGCSLKILTERGSSILGAIFTISSYSQLY